MNAATPEHDEWFGQPKGLTFLFLTEMWEKFSYFGMRAMLVYYMTKQLHFSPSLSSLVYGMYGAGTYLTPIAGGMIADRWLGKRRAVIIGGSLMALGHFAMASEALLFPALALIALGNGLFLPSLPSQVSGLYADHDPRRSGAYNVYYAGINLGSLLAPLVCGTLGELYGWHYGFGAAGVGMCLGLANYMAGMKHLPVDIPACTAGPAAARLDAGLIKKLLYVGLAVVLFRIAYEQTGNSVALWADSAVNHTIWGWEIPVTWVQSLNPAFIFLLTPLLMAHWRRAAMRGRETAATRKMALGAFGLALSYLLLAGVCHAAGTQTVSGNWLALFFLALTISELYVLPVGLGLFAQIAPRGLGATLVAAWYLASFAGNLLAGIAGSAWDVSTPVQFFSGMAAISTAAGLMLLGSRISSVHSLTDHERTHQARSIHPATGSP